MSEDTRVTDVQIVSITFDTTIQGQSKAYPGTEVIYKKADGKVETKAMHTNSFKFNPTLRPQLEALSPGDYARITDIKDGQFRKWQTVQKLDGKPEASAPAALPPTTVRPASQAAQPPSAAQVRSNYETPEERAHRQVLIVRQSSLTAALKLAEVANVGNLHTPDEASIIASAKIFEEYVLGTAKAAAESEVRLPE